MSTDEVSDARIAKLEQVIERLTAVLESLDRDMRELKSELKKLPLLDRLSDRVDATSARVSRIESGLMAVIWVVIVAVIGAVLTLVLK